MCLRWSTLHWTSWVRGGYPISVIWGLEHYYILAPYISLHHMLSKLPTPTHMCTHITIYMHTLLLKWPLISWRFLWPDSGVGSSSLSCLNDWLMILICLEWLLVQTGWSEYIRNCWSPGISPHNNLEFMKNYPKKRKYPVSGSSLGKNAFLMPEANSRPYVNRSWL